MTPNDAEPSRPAFRTGCTGLLLLSLGITSCFDQYRPVWFWNKLDKERQTAARELPKLKADGTLPDLGGGPAVQLSAEDKAYNNYCSPCHAMDGNGKGPAGAGLQPHPRDFTDKSWQKTVTDAKIAKVIKEGGASVGLSASMAAWGNVLNDDMINKLTMKIRKFGE